MEFSDTVKKEIEETAQAELLFARVLSSTRPEFGRECAAVAIQIELCECKSMLLANLAKVEERLQKNGAVVEKFLKGAAE